MPTREEMKKGLVTAKFIPHADELLEVHPGLQLNAMGPKEHNEELARKGQRKLDDLELHKVHGARR